MMGKDVEKMIQYIEEIKSGAIFAINQLAQDSAYQIKSRATHGGLSTASCTPEEKEVSGNSGIGHISTPMGKLEEYCSHMDTLEQEHYIESNQFNNCIGSPWSELKKLQAVVSMAEAYSANSMNYIGEKAGMLSVLCMVYTTATDTKWAMIYYHDYIQRGFDHLFNKDEPSITYNNGLEDEQTTGNVTQEFKENVNIPVPSIDPY